jgi:phospholipid/cholesterol/gamma-HCH transport system permease protein
MLDTAAAVRRALFGKRGRRLGWASLWPRWSASGAQHPDRHARAVLHRLILALRWRRSCKDYGALNRVADIISIAVFASSGRSSARSCSRASPGRASPPRSARWSCPEEIEALEAQAISPIRFLVVPPRDRDHRDDGLRRRRGRPHRRASAGCSWQAAARHRRHAVPRAHLRRDPDRDFVTGLVKAAVFGTLISSLACYLGLGVLAGQGVGVATTRTVVYTIVRPDHRRPAVHAVVLRHRL